MGPRDTIQGGSGSGTLQRHQTQFLTPLEVSKSLLLLVLDLSVVSDSIVGPSSDAQGIITTLL